MGRNKAPAEKQPRASEASATTLPRGGAANPTKGRGKRRAPSRAKRGKRGGARTQKPRGGDEYGRRKGAGLPPARLRAERATDPRSGQEAHPSRRRTTSPPPSRGEGHTTKKPRRTRQCAANWQPHKKLKRGWQASRQRTNPEPGRAI